MQSNQFDNTIFSQRHDSIVTLTKGKGAGGGNQRVESSIVNNMSSTSKVRNLTPQNNTFFVDSSHTDKDNDESLHEDRQETTEKAHNDISSSAAVLDESDSFCCDASSQLLGNKIL